MTWISLSTCPPEDGERLLPRSFHPRRQRHADPRGSFEDVVRPLPRPEVAGDAAQDGSQQQHVQRSAAQQKVNEAPFLIGGPSQTWRFQYLITPKGEQKKDGVAPYGILDLYFYELISSPK